MVEAQVAVLEGELLADKMRSPSVSTGRRRCKSGRQITLYFSPCKGEMFIDRESPEILSAVRRSGTQLERFGRVSSAPPNGVILCGCAAAINMSFLRNEERGELNVYGMITFAAWLRRGKSCGSVLGL